MRRERRSIRFAKREEVKDTGNGNLQYHIMAPWAEGWGAGGLGPRSYGPRGTGAGAVVGAAASCHAMVLR